MSNKINKGHYHEVIDRIAVMQNNIEDNLRKGQTVIFKKFFTVLRVCNPSRNGMRVITQE